MSPGTQVETGQRELDLEGCVSQAGAMAQGDRACHINMQTGVEMHHTT